MEVPKGAKVIESRSDYPHMFVRAQVYNDADRANIPLIQSQIKLTGKSNPPLSSDDPIKFALENHDVYPQNKELLESAIGFDQEDYLRVSHYIGASAFVKRKSEDKLFEEGGLLCLILIQIT